MFGKECAGKGRVEEIIHSDLKEGFSSLSKSLLVSTKKNIIPVSGNGIKYQIYLFLES